MGCLDWLPQPQVSNVLGQAGDQTGPDEVCLPVLAPAGF